MNRHFPRVFDVIVLISALGLASCAGTQQVDSTYGDGEATNFRLIGENESHWSDSVITPVSMPYLFEPPQIQSNIQVVGIHHEFPETGVVGGGDLQALAVQGRLAVTDRLAIIAVKDGYVDFNPRNLPKDEGFVDVGGGVKYAFYDDPEEKILMTAGLTYETTTGDREILQGNGKGMWRPFVSGLWGTDAVNTIVTFGGQIPNSDGSEPTSVDAHLHISPANFGPFVPLLEVNGIYYVDDADGPPVSLELVDYGTLGSSQVKGQTFATAAAGGKWRITDRMDLGFAYERTITNRKYIFDQRITADWIFRF